MGNTIEAADEPLELAPSPNGFGTYRLLAKLGEGGMAEVFVAVNAEEQQTKEGFHKLVALKLLRDSMARDEEFVAMFKQEARLAARLNHRNCIQVHDIELVGQNKAIIMEYLEGASFGRLLRAYATAAGEPIPLAISVRILCDALRGLEYAHDLKDYDGTPLNVVHRDFTPANVFVTLDGQVKVLDFGIAKASDSTQHTATGVFKGTVRYMSPDVLRGEEATPLSDIYMAGVILWELLSQRRMWPSEEKPLTVMQRVGVGDLPALPATAPEPLAAVCRRALSLRPAARFASVKELRTAILEACRTAGLSAGEEELLEVLEIAVGDSCREQRAIVEGQLAAAAAARTSLMPQLPSIGEHLSSGSDGGNTGAVTLAQESGSRARAPVVRPHAPRWPLIASAVAALTFAIALAAVLMWPDLGAGPSRDSTETAAAPAPTDVDVVVDVTPSDARVSLDGVMLRGSPPQTRAERDGVVHMLRAEAPGYSPASIAVRLDADTRVRMSLEPVPEPRPSPPAAVAPPQETEATAAGRASRMRARAARRSTDSETTSPPTTPQQDRLEPLRPATQQRRIDVDSPYGD